MNRNKVGDPNFTVVFVLGREYLYIQSPLCLFIFFCMKVYDYLQYFPSFSVPLTFSSIWQSFSKRLLTSPLKTPLWHFLLDTLQDPFQKICLHCRLRFPDSCLFESNKLFYGFPFHSPVLLTSATHSSPSIPSLENSETSDSILQINKFLTDILTTLRWYHKFEISSSVVWWRG